MNVNKITQIHVYIIGAVLALIVGFGLYFSLLKPLNDQNTILRGNISSTESTPVQIDGKSFNISQVKQAEQALEGVRKRKTESQARLAVLERQKQLPAREAIDIGNGTQPELLSKTMPRWLNLPRVVVTRMESFAKRQATKHGVQITTQFAAPAPVPDPNAIPKDIIIWNLGPISARGDFNKVMRWMESWNQAPLLTSVEGLKCSLAGSKGEVMATAAVTVYIFPTGKGVTQPGAGGGGAMPGAAPGMDPGMAGAPGSSGMMGVAGGNGP
jgi:hypothetical protein